MALPFVVPQPFALDHPWGWVWIRVTIRAACDEFPYAGAWSALAG